MRPVQIFKFRTSRSSDILRLPEKRRLIRRLVISPPPVEVQPSNRHIGAARRKGCRGRVVRVDVGIERGIPQDPPIRVVQQEAGGEVDAWDGMVVLPCHD